MVKRFFYVLSQNPIFLLKRVFFEIKAMIMPLPKSGKYETSGVLFNFDFDFSHKIKKMYFGIFQPIISEVLRKYLKKGDTFIDIGANIGYFSFVAAQLVGKEGQVHSFEPVQKYFDRLDNFAKINNQYNIKTNQLALGDKKDNLEIFIKGGADIGNNTFFPDLLEGASERSVQVSVIRLDEYIKENNLKNISLIKIDVEGFEFPVLKGMDGYFEQCSENGSCPIIICEVVPGAYKKKGDIKELFDYMAEYSYYPFNILNNNKRININKIAKGQLSDIIFKHIIK